MRALLLGAACAGAAGCSGEIAQAPVDDAGPFLDALHEAAPDSTTAVDAHVEAEVDVVDDKVPIRDVVSEPPIPDTSVPDVDFSYDAPYPDIDAPACQLYEFEILPLPLDLAVLLDASLGMGADCSLGQAETSPWCRSIHAISAFVAAPDSAGTQAALTPFSGDSCDPSSYGTSVPFTLLDGTSLPASVFETALDAEAPGGSRPMAPALAGTTFPSGQRAHAVVLITNGLPDACGDTTQEANVAASQFVDAGIRTFVLGLGAADFGALETISEQGGAVPHTSHCHGTTPCHHFDVGQGEPAVFEAALQAMLAAAGRCHYTVPNLEAGVLDPDMLELKVYSPNGAFPLMQRVPNAASCTAVGWYYDDNQNPTQIVLCPETCGWLLQDPGAVPRAFAGCLY